MNDEFKIIGRSIAKLYEQPNYININFKFLKTIEKIFILGCFVFCAFLVLKIVCGSLKDKGMYIEDNELEFENDIHTVRFTGGSLSIVDGKKNILSVQDKSKIYVNLINGVLTINDPKNSTLRLTSRKYVSGITSYRGSLTNKQAFR
jgi:hypothetical protein